MDKSFTKSFCFLLFFFFSYLTQSAAQTVTISNVDAGPYGQGSTITAPFQINTTSGCIGTKNVFTLYLSDATGSFASEKAIGTFTGFYASFINGIIPAGTPAGNGYRLRVGTSLPSAFSAPSAPFTISGSAGVVAATTSQVVNTSNPEVFGTCIGVDNTSFTFTNNSTTGTTATASFYNELAQADEGSINLNGSFIAKAAHYTVTVRAIDGAGTVGTKSYLLMNNMVNNSFGASGSTTVCLNGANKLSYNVDITSATGIQKNYPGMIYKVLWGDGAVNELTFCDIKNSGGMISHNYIKTSCGNNVNGQLNVFEVDLQPVNPYCGNVVTQVTVYAKVLAPPQNRFDAPLAGCANTEVTFVNTSYPGQDPNSTAPDCVNVNALYTWLVDGAVVAQNYTAAQTFTYKFTATGSHRVTLHLQNNTGLCAADDVDKTICVQDPPKPSFTLPTTLICSPGTVTPANTSIVDNNCIASNQFVWVVTGPAPVAYDGGTNANSKQPNFRFNTSGIYSVRLDITTESCGVVSSPEQTIIVNATPIAALSADASLCGNNNTLNFNANPGVTRTILTGTNNPINTTYLWTVTGGNFEFTGGTDATSQYPQILFKDYATYTVSVTHTNNCGTATDSQQLVFQEAPLVSAGADITVCEGTPVVLAGSITGAVNSFQWAGGNGTFSPNRNALNATYNPTAAEINAGQVILTLRALTAVAAPCNIINDDVVITLIKKDVITSELIKAVCNGETFNYTVTSANPISTYTWTAAVTSSNASGFTATGSGNTISDVLTNNSATFDAVITYTITPLTNGCPGTPAQLKVTVKALPVASATVASAEICSNQPSGVSFTSNIAGSVFTWTSTASAGITGNSNPTTPVTAGNIDDVLVNTGTTTGTVTYTITPYNGTCMGTPKTITVNVKPLPVTSVPGPDEEICNTPTYKLKANDPGSGTGKWTVASGQTGITFSDDTRPDATVSGLLPGNVYQFKWTITAAPTCPPSSNIVTIKVDNETIGGTTAGAATVCAGSNSGTVTLSGHVGNVLRWETSADNGVTWLVLPVTANTISYTNLVSTTQYRAVVQSGVCAMLTSAITTITVNEPVVAANAGTDVKLCNAATVTLNGNSPAPFNGVWTQTAGPTVTFVNATDPKTQVNGLLGGNIYKFVWTIKGLPPCTDSFDEVLIENSPDVTAAFTANKTADCGPFMVSFTNTSTLTTGVNFVWDFGDGSPVSNLVNPQHTFQPGTDGKDKVYTVSLLVPDNCVLRPAFTATITVRPSAPVANIIPANLSGCGAFAIKLQNASPGNNALYEFYLFDGNNQLQKITRTDKSEVIFDPVTTPVTKVYTVYMEVTDLCGTKTKSNNIPITISPATFIAQTFVKNNANIGCAPFNVTFVNNSSGGNVFKYNIYNVDNVLIESVTAGKTDFPYLFVNPGIFFVSITASNDCGALESAKIKVEVSATPAPNFDADIKTGCRKISVNFANLTPTNGTTPSASLSYEWDFGDGSPHSFNVTPPTHTYDYKKSPYTVTLTVTNQATGCTNTMVKQKFIVVESPPGTEFTVKPDFVTTIPNYSFSFVDQTTGSNLISWRWTFGDGSSSTSRNPTHTYADTGKYEVKLVVVSRTGCDSAITHTVRITGVPGQLYLPNAFTPNGSSTELRSFTAKGSGLASWRLQVFNKWGQLVWETTKLNSNGEPVESWDGTFKGMESPQGVYIWQATAKFINGTDWKGMSYNNSLPKRTGAINLIR
jgi:PKD repeat protein